jgi:preprotein translocase subunit SecG
LDHAIDGYMYIFAPLVFVICYLLERTQGRGHGQTAAASEEARLKLRGVGTLMTRPLLITVAGFGSFIHVFGYLRS